MQDGLLPRALRQVGLDVAGVVQNRKCDAWSLLGIERPKADRELTVL